MCSHTPLRDHRGEFIGVVSNIQDLTQVKLMAEELTGYQKMTNALRAQNHEFMNKLHTISGLIQLEAFEEAVDYISVVSDQRERLSGIINDRIENTLFCHPAGKVQPGHRGENRHGNRSGLLFEPSAGQDFRG